MAREQRHVKNHSIAAAAVPAVPAAAVAAAAIAACAVGTASASAAASAPASVASAHVAGAATAFSENDRVCFLASYCLKTFSKRLVSKEEIPDVVLTLFHHMGKRLHGQLLVVSNVRWATGSTLARCTNVIQL